MFSNKMVNCCLPKQLINIHMLISNVYMYKHSAGFTGCDFLQRCCLRPLLSRHHAVFYPRYRCRPTVSDADDTHRVVCYCRSHLHRSGQILQSIHFFLNEKLS